MHKLSIKVMLVIALLCVPLRCFAQEPENRLYKLDENDRLIVYVDLDSLSTNLDDIPETVPGIFTANYWLYVYSKNVKGGEMRVYERMKYDTNTDQIQTKAMITCYYQNGKLTNSEDGELNWHVLSADGGGYKAGQKIFKRSLLAWDFTRYKLTGVSQIKVK
jgi:hypothetical protein